jgi:outer membrane protein assembly factor BamB
MTNWKLGALAAGLAVALLFPRATRSQAISVNLTGLLTSPAICDGVAYFCSDNGKLYGINASDGTAVPGFPVDITAAVADGSVPNYHTRPGVYYGSLGKAIYVETSKHGVVKVWPNGTVAWINKLADGLPYGDYCTPAVTSQGEVIAEKITADNIYLVKLKESDGTVIGNSPPLANFNYSEVSPPAIANGNIYITVWPNPAAGTDMNTSVLDLADLTVKASFLGSYADNHAPYVRGNGVYIGSNQDIGATVLKLNSAPVPASPGYYRMSPVARLGKLKCAPHQPRLTGIPAAQFTLPSD